MFGHVREVHRILFYLSEFYFMTSQYNNRTALNWFELTELNWQDQPCSDKTVVFLKRSIFSVQKQRRLEASSNISILGLTSQSADLREASLNDAYSILSFDPTIRSNLRQVWTMLIQYWVWSHNSVRLEVSSNDADSTLGLTPQVVFAHAKFPQNFLQVLQLQTREQRHSLIRGRFVAAMLIFIAAKLPPVFAVGKVNEKYRYPSHCNAHVCSSKSLQERIFVATISNLWQ